jgi:hypothetical protein
MHDDARIQELVLPLTPDELTQASEINQARLQYQGCGAEARGTEPGDGLCVNAIRDRCVIRS